MASLIGDKGFREWVYAALLLKLVAEGKSDVIQPDLTMDHMIAGIADDNDISVMEVTRLIKGPQKK